MGLRNPHEWDVFYYALGELELVRELFGMQYLIAGGFCLRENAHVRVDVVHMHLSERGRAAADLVTSVFFFIFTLTLLVTGWTFFNDALRIQEVSLTEWAIQ